MTEMVEPIIKTVDSTKMIADINDKVTPQSKQAYFLKCDIMKTRNSLIL